MRPIQSQLNPNSISLRCQADTSPNPRCANGLYYDQNGRISQTENSEMGLTAGERTASEVQWLFPKMGSTGGAPNPTGRRIPRSRCGPFGLSLLGGDPGNAIPRNGVLPTANPEIGVS